MISWKQRATAPFSGEYCCINDYNWTIISDAGELAGLLEYKECDKDEMARLSQKGIWNICVREARDTMRNKMKQQLQASNQVELLMPIYTKSGNIKWVMNRGIRTMGDDGQEYICGILLDITLSKLQYDIEKEADGLVKEQAKLDSLTKLYNAFTSRKLAEEYLTNCDGNIKNALLIIDLDNFKQINDHFGHMFGDVVLVQVANIIKKLFRSGDIVGRIGGDEFMVLMKRIPDVEIIRKRCEQINEILGTTFEKDFADCKPSCSIGVAFWPEQGTSYYHLFCCADKALYYAKESGRKQYVFYDSSLEKTDRCPQYANYDDSVLQGYIE